MKKKLIRSVICMGIVIILTVLFSNVVCAKSYSNTEAYYYETSDYRYYENDYESSEYSKDVEYKYENYEYDDYGRYDYKYSYYNYYNYKYMNYYYRALYLLNLLSGRFPMLEKIFLRIHCN
jgi:hypothetical protein